MTVIRRPPRRVVLSLDTRAEAYAALRRKGLPFNLVDRAFRRWREGYPAEACRFGHEQAIALDCSCEGCLESLCMLFFDQVAKKFGHTV